MKRINDCSMDKYNKYRRIEQLQDPDIRELYLETVSLQVMTETLELGRELTTPEIRAIEESVDIRKGDILRGELEFDLLTEHIRRGLSYEEAAVRAQEDAAGIHASLFDESLN